VVESLEPPQPKQPASTQPASTRAAGDQPCEAKRTLHDQRVAALLTEQRDSLATFLRICGARQEAEDVLQETMERAWQYRHNCNLEQAPKAWLRQAAFRCWLDFKKRSKRQPVSIGDHGATVPARPDDAPELRDQLQHAMQHMTKLERTVLLRFHQHGDTLLELAKDLNMNVNTVKSHLHRARRRLPRGDWS
jgi:RNA polymerase sigma-70 factor (ECF subfamily)